MAYDLKEFKERTKDSSEWLTKEFSSIRTGRATPALLDGIQVESYGARVPLSQVGSIGVEDARTLRVTSWDAGQIKEIEKAITDANLGVGVMVDDKGVRVVFPELTSERRAQLIKLAKSKFEDARVSLRKVRDEAVKGIEADEKAGEIGEDEKFRIKEEIQKTIDDVNGVFDDMLHKKEVEIDE